MPVIFHHAPTPLTPPSSTWFRWNKSKTICVDSLGPWVLLAMQPEMWQRFISMSQMNGHWFHRCYSPLHRCDFIHVMLFQTVSIRFWPLECYSKGLRVYFFFCHYCSNLDLRAWNQTVQSFSSSFPERIKQLIRQLSKYVKAFLGLFSL